MAIMVIYEYKIFGEVFMSKLLEEIKHGVDVTIPEMEDLNQVEHPKIDYTLYILRNIFVVAAAVLFLLSFFCTAHITCLKRLVIFAAQ